MQYDRKQLAREVQEFEAQKEAEKKKMEEDKKRIKRDKVMLEKALRDRKANYDQKAQDEIEELQAKVRNFWGLFLLFCQDFAIQSIQLMKINSP